jgi:tetratricopeptide (TPR) repeat protein
VEHWLADEPLGALPDTFVDRVARLARRHKGAVRATVAALVLLVGLVGAWRYQHEHDLRIREAEKRDEIGEALQRTQSWIEIGWTQTAEYKVWQTTLDRARTEFARAERFLEDRDITPALRDRVIAVRKELDDANDALRLDEEIDRLIVKALDSGTRKKQYKMVAGEIRELFKKRGMDVLDPGQHKRIIDWVGNHRASTQLKILLTAWWVWIPLDDVKERLLLTPVVLALDPGFKAHYTKWGIALALRDGEALVRLASDPDVANLPNSGKVLMGIALRSRDKVDEAVRFLERWQELHPNDYWLNYQLGIYLQQTQPPRTAEALRYLTAAVAIRPDDPRAHSALGSAYQRSGEAIRANAAYERASKLAPQK